MVRKFYILRLFAAFSLLFAANGFAAATDWSWTVPSGSGSFTATESTNSVSIAGGVSRLSNGFLKFTLTSGSGGGVPSNGTVKYGVEAPGFALFVEPVLTYETQIISNAVRGTCPDRAWEGNFVFSAWPASGVDLTSTAQPSYGKFTWTPSTNTLRINSIYELVNHTVLVSNVDIPGSCTDGVITLSGSSADRQGKIYLDSTGGSVYMVGSNGKAVYALPSLTIPDTGKLNGTYTVLRYDNGASQDIKGIRMTIASGTTATGDELTNIETGATNTSATWRFQNISINTPIDGFFTADLDLEGSYDTLNNVICEVYFRDKTVIYCLGNSPTDSTQPINFAMVSDDVAITGMELDSYSFDTDGYTAGGLSSQNETSYGLALQPDGKLLQVGASDVSSAMIVVRRYYPDGQLDANFSSDGVLLDTFADSGYGAAKAIAIDNNSKIVVAGTAGNAEPTSKFGINRYNSDGTLDTSFNASGRVVVSVGTSGTNDVRAVAIDGSNNILITGQSEEGSLDDVFVARIDGSNGSLDSDFSSDGYLSRYGVSTFSSKGVDIGVLSSGKIVVAIQEEGMTDSLFAAWRLNSDGSFDSTFGYSGTASLDLTDPLTENAMAIQPDNKIVLVGSADVGSGDIRFAIARLTTAGSADTTFSTDGMLTVDIPSHGPDDATDVALQVDGKIVVAGDASNAHALVRLNSDGSLDSTFGTSGIFAQSYYSSSQVSSIVIQSDKKIVVGGYYWNSTDYDFTVTRFWP